MTKLPSENIKSTRRAFCATSVGAGAALLFSPLQHLQTCAGERSGEESPLPPANLREIAVSSFTDDELDLPFYVAHFHELANSVIMQGENRGFISIPVWRNQRDNKPYNARIMENILSLAFFYVTKRPWNPFYGDPRLRYRLELALDFWCRSAKEGRFSEYSQGGYNLAATAFATKFMGETLFHLKNGTPKIDADLMDRVRKTDLTVIETVLSHKDLRNTGTRFSNQFTNVYAGAFAYLDLFPNKELETLLKNTIHEMGPRLQSPVGFFYENNGPDWSYNLGTHHSNLRMCWFYTKGMELGEVFAEEERRFLDWLSDNAVYDPASKGYWLNKQVETRQSLGFWQGYPAGKSGNDSTFLCEASSLAFPFMPTEEEKQEWEKTTRADLTKDWPKVPPLVKGNFYAFAPYRFLHRRHESTFPKREEKEQAMQHLPYFAKERWTRQRCDSRRNTCFTFIRRPNYYLIFNSGEKSSSQQNFGMGLLWRPKEGVLLQSQRHPSPMWGTRPDGSEMAVEGNALTAQFFSGDQEVKPQPGIQEWSNGPLRIQYGWKPQGKKVLECLEDTIKITVDCSGRFTECFPFFLVSGKEYRLERIQFETGKTKLSFAGALETRMEEMNLSVGGKKLFLLEVTAKDRLEYVLS